MAVQTEDAAKHPTSAVGQTRTSGRIRGKSVHPLIADLRLLRWRGRLAPLPDSCTAPDSNNVRCIHVTVELSTAPTNDFSLSSDYATRPSERTDWTSLSVRTSPGGWRSPERFLEGARKGRLGTVTDQIGNLRK